MKKIFLGLMVIILALGLIGCNIINDNEGVNDNDDVNDGGNKQQDGSQEVVKKEEYTYGYIDNVNGNFFTNMWGQSLVENSIKEKLYGCSLVISKDVNIFEVNKEVVENLNITSDENGNKVFEFEISKELKFSDGSPITAKDYVFAMLFRNHQETLDLSVKKDKILEEIILNVRLLGEYTFSIAANSNALPIYNELGYLSFEPLPLKVLAPMADIYDNGKGAEIVGEFSNETLENTINLEKAGYRYFPKVTSGAYYMDSVSEEGSITLIANPYYKLQSERAYKKIGDYNKIHYKKISEEIAVDSIVSGDIDQLLFLNSVLVKNKVSKYVENGELEENTYYRNGFGKIVFACDVGATRSKNVRQAIAYIIDGDGINKKYTGSVDNQVIGCYSLEHWIYKENKERVDKELNKYLLDIEKAKALLIEDCWILNSRGLPFVEGTDTVRYKQGSTGLEPLKLVHLVSGKSEVSKLITENMLENAKKIGIDYKCVEVSDSVLMDNLFGLVPERKFNMINVGVDFSSIFEPFYAYNVENKYFGEYNVSFIKDEELMKAIIELKNVDVDNKAQYLDKWMNFQKVYNEVLPELPLYCNSYSDLIRNTEKSNK